MPFTLFDLLSGAHRRMGTLSIGVSSAGTSTTLIDSNVGIGAKDDQFNNGTIFFIGVGAGTTAIDGQFRKIADFAAATGTFTFSALSGSVGAGSTYAYTGGEYPTEMTVELANDVLRSFGPMTFIDKNTLTSSANQDEYTAQLVWKYAPPTQIDVQTYTGSTANINDWVTVRGWHYEPSSAGATAKLIFDERLPAGRKVRIWYQDYHHRVTGSTAPIDERIDPDLAITGLISRLYEYRVRRERSSEPGELRAWLDARDSFEERKAERPLWKKPRARKLLTLGYGERQTYPWPST